MFPKVQVGCWVASRLWGTREEVGSEDGGVDQAGSRGPDLYRWHQQELLTGWEKWRIRLCVERGELLGRLLRAGRGPDQRELGGP